METAVRAEQVGRSYGERPALRGISFELETGQTLAVFGSNGAGKSTLLRLLAALMRPHSGTLTVLGAELPSNAWTARGRIGYLGHDPLLYRELSTRENLTFHARLHGVGHDRIGPLIDAVGLANRADDPIRELSRGLVQRAAVARAVLHDPPLLLLDEPRAGLDPQAAEALEPLIGRSSGRTRVVVSHDVDSALADCDAALGLSAGDQRFHEPRSKLTPAIVRELYK